MIPHCTCRRFAGGIAAAKTRFPIPHSPAFIVLLFHAPRERLNIPSFHVRLKRPIGCRMTCHRCVFRCVQVLSGQSWVMIDECVVDVADFAQRHPGGRRLILNGLGTDVTQEILGKSLPMGPSTSFPPNVHSGVRTTIFSFRFFTSEERFL